MMHDSVSERPKGPIHGWSWRRLRTPLIATGVYLFLSHMLIGTRPEQFVLVGLFSVLYLLSSTTRRWVLGFSIFIVFWVIFDSMKAFPNYLVNEVHIGDLYHHERSLFGIHDGATILTPNEYWHLHVRSGLDLMSGVFYLCWMPVPLAFAAFLFIRDKEQFLRFSLTFFLVNMLGFAIYYLYPAAPPWYVELHGFDFIPGTPGNTAGLSRFDALTGTSIFSSIYAESSNVFAAMPSLHSAYPVVVLYIGLKSRLGWINIVFAIIMCGIWFSAVYAGHHYVLDVLVGICCAISGIILFNRLMNWKVAQHLFRRYQAAITAASPVRSTR